MNGQARMNLGSQSRAKVYGDHMILEKGASELAGSSEYWIQARGLRIQSVESDSGASISLLGDNQVIVGATRGTVRVANSKGVLVAQVQPGRPMQLEPQKSTSFTPSSTLTGCLQKIDGHYILTDGTAGVTVELKGIGLEVEVGNRVEAIGLQDLTVAPAPIASQVINTISLRQVSKGCAPPAAAAAAAPPTIAHVGGGAISTKVIVAGVIVAGAATGTVVGVTRGNDEKKSISQ
jgi:hypothetical protein